MVTYQFQPHRSLQPEANSARESEDYKVTCWTMKCINHRRNLDFLFFLIFSTEAIVMCLKKFSLTIHKRYPKLNLLFILQGLHYQLVCNSFTKPPINSVYKAVQIPPGNSCGTDCQICIFLLHCKTTAAGSLFSEHKGCNNVRQRVWQKHLVMH